MQRQLPLFWLLFFQLVVSWGPFTHQLFSCYLVQCPQSNVTGPCICPGNAGDATFSLMLGASAPDAVKSLDGALHSFEFAARLYHYSLEHPSNSSFHPQSFALGFGMHIAEDYCGHHQNGFLNQDSDRDHIQEFGADTYLVDRHKSMYRSFQFALHNNDSRNYFAQAISDLSQGQQSISRVLQALNDFDEQCTLERDAIALNFLYVEELAYADICGHSNLSVIVPTLQLAQIWSAVGAETWTSSISSLPDPSGSESAQAASDCVDSFFQHHGGTVC